MTLAHLLLTMHVRIAGIAQLVERNLAKVEVASSNLVSRSMARWQNGYAAVCKTVPCRFDSDPRLHIINL